MANNEKYFVLAIDWGKKYLQDNTEPKNLQILKHKIVTDDLAFVATCVTRIEQGAPIVKYQSYCLLKEFKDFIEKIKQNCLLEKI